MRGIITPARRYCPVWGYNHPVRLDGFDKFGNTAGMTMSKFFVILAVIYLAATVGAGTAALLTTLWAYNTDARIVSDTVTAAIINTAAAVAAMGFFGGFDMIFTIWQFMRNQEAEKAREAERAEERKTREEERKAQQAEREAMLATMRAEREQFMTQLQAQLQAERERRRARRRNGSAQRRQHRRNAGPQRRSHRPPHGTYRSGHPTQ